MDSCGANQVTFANDPSKHTNRRTIYYSSPVHLIYCGVSLPYHLRYTSVRKRRKHRKDQRSKQGKTSDGLNRVLGDPFVILAPDQWRPI